jgi:tetratricopeptide (TPR) repeat protein
MRGEPEAALEELERLGDEGLVVSALASVAALAAGRPERALEHASAGVAGSPHSAIAHGRLATALEALERFDQAAAAWRTVLEIEPHSGMARVALGALAERAGNPEAARAHYEAAVAGRTTGAAVWRLAALEIEAGRRERARELLAGLDDESRVDSAAALRLARAECAAGRAEDAVRRLEAEMTARPNDLGVALGLGDALHAAGRSAAAAAAYARVLRLAEEALDAETAQTSPLLTYRARALAGLGRRQEAREALAGALREPGALAWPLRDEARALAASLDRAGS